MKTSQIMRLTAVVGMLASSAWAADEAAGKPQLEVQTKQRSEIIAKYDGDKDGVLSQQEMKQLSPDDKHALARSGGVGTAKKPATKDGEPKVKVEGKSPSHKFEHPAPHNDAKGAKAPKAKGKK
jgi:hypothetical protein